METQVQDDKFKDYVFNKINAFSQFHIVRRLAPIIGELIAALSASVDLKSGKDLKAEDLNFDSIAKNLSPVMEALAKIPDSDVEYCIKELLRGVQRRQIGGALANVMTPNGAQFMFQDIEADLTLMLGLAGKSLMTNLGGFINALPSGLKEGARQSNVIG